MCEPPDHAWQKYSMTVGFGVLLVATVLGFLRVEALDRELEERNIERAFLLCEKDNDVRELLTTTLRTLFMESDREFSEELEVIEERLTALEKSVLAPNNCARIASERANK
jgi:hypothetical protein